MDKAGKRKRRPFWQPRLPISTRRVCGWRKNSTARFTYLFVHHKRGREALESEASLFQDFKNWAVHDCWASYFDFDFEQCRHALCGAQLLRELTNLMENGSKWAIQMHQFMLDLYKVSQKARVPVADKQAWVREFQHISAK